MVRIRLTREERRQKFREARKGWASTKGMGRGTYLDWQKQRHEQREKKKEEIAMKKDAEKRKREMQNTAKTGVTPPKWKARGKLLIVVVVIALIVYLILRYLK